jgi:hypothetical protein
MIRALRACARQWSIAQLDLAAPSLWEEGHHETGRMLESLYVLMYLNRFSSHPQARLRPLQIWRSNIISDAYSQGFNLAC